VNGGVPHKPTFQVIPIDKIDEPELAMRETMSDEGLAELASSIRELGLLQPLGVIQTGSRYRVVYGHRRRIAAPRAGLTEVAAYVFPEGTTTEEAMKVAENSEREDVNPAAEASYYLHLFEHRCGRDVEKLARLVNRKESFVQNRLALGAGDPDVLDALRQDLIPIAIAHELNRVKDPMYRRLFLHDAIQQGLTVVAVRTLRQNLERQQQIQEARSTGEYASVPASSEAPLASIDQCVLCNSAEDAHDMEYVRVHRSCRQVLDRKARTAIANEQM